MVRLSVRAHPRARHEEIRAANGGSVEIWLRAPAIDGRANDGIERMISDALGLRRSAVRIVRGATSRDKLIEIECTDLGILERLHRGHPD
ncbi:MAG: DUF167 domain-containing protein [Chloroflexota bacterium]